jgi:hypothetical protein
MSINPPETTIAQNLPQRVMETTFSQLKGNVAKGCFGAEREVVPDRIGSYGSISGIWRADESPISEDRYEVVLPN